MIEIIRGDDVTLRATFTDIDGNPIDLTGGTVFFTVKDDLNDLDASAIISKEVTSFVSPTTGIMTITLTNSETDVEIGRYYYDIQLKKSGLISSSDRGRFVVVQDVTLRVS